MCVLKYFRSTLKVLKSMTQKYLATHQKEARDTQMCLDTPFEKH